MKRRIFIPAIILLIASATAAQQQEHVVEATHVNKPRTKKIVFLSSPEAANHIQLPSDAAVAGHLEGRLVFSGHVRKQKLHGDWVSYYTTNNVLDSGHLHHGVPDGEWKRWDSSGQLLSIRHYDAGKLKQVKEEIRLAHPKRFFYALTALYRVNRSQALHTMTAAYSFSFSEAHHFPKTLQQMVENNSSAANTYIPVFNECLHHGLYMNFFAGGVTKDSGYYKNGLREDVWLHRASSAGSYFIGSYKNGHRYREWKQYDASGRLLSIIFYNKEGLAEWTRTIRR